MYLCTILSSVRMIEFSPYLVASSRPSLGIKQDKAGFLLSWWNGKQISVLNSMIARILHALGDLRISIGWPLSFTNVLHHAFKSSPVIKGSSHLTISSFNCKDDWNRKRGSETR